MKLLAALLFFLAAATRPWTAAAQVPLQPVPMAAPIPVLMGPNEELIVSVENPPTILVADLYTGKVKRTLTHGAWQPSGAGRPIAVDEGGHLFTVDVATNTIWVFDRLNRLLRSFVVDQGCAGSPGGSGIRDLAFTARGTLVALGGWASGSINFLLEIDPETGSTIHCCNLNAVVGATFEGARIAIDSEGLVYVTQYNPPSGPKSVAKVNMATCALEAMIATPAVDAGLIDIEVLPSGAILVGDSTAGTVWLSDPQQATWCAATPCAGVPHAHQTFTAGHGFVYGHAAVGCGNGPGWVDVIPLGCGSATTEQFDLGVPSVAAMVIRHG